MGGFNDRIASFLEGKLSGASDVRLERCERVSGGFSWEVFRVDAAWRVGSEAHCAAYILRMAPEGGVLEPYDAEREFRILAAVGAAGIPVPRVLWMEKDPRVLGREFYVMEYVPGEVPVPWDPTLANDPARARPMRERFVEVVAAVHRLDWRAAGLEFLGVPPPGQGVALQQIEFCRTVYERDRSGTDPAIEVVLDWLRRNAPSSEHTRLVHGDCRIGNCIWRDDGIVALLDWERAFLGDPMADIAWTRSLNTAGWCSIDGEMTAIYERLSGIPIDEARVHYWTVLEGLKAVTIGLTALKAFNEDRGRDLRLVTIGHMARLGLPVLLEAIR